MADALQGGPEGPGAHGLGWEVLRAGPQGAFPLPPQSQNKAKQCKDSAMEAGTRLAHLLSLGGGAAWPSFPPQHTSFTLGTQSHTPHSCFLKQVKRKIRFLAFANTVHGALRVLTNAHKQSYEVFTVTVPLS